MNRVQIINAIIQKYGYKSYLEIGISNSDCFDNIQCEQKIGVDPDLQTNALCCMDSDRFFLENIKKYDMVFIDGLHHAEQVYKDILNALDVLEENGTIVCHDMNPRGFQEQYVPRQQKIWNGDCWKSWIRLRQERNDLEMFVINCDEGTAIIRKGKQKKLITNVDINYDNFVKNKKEWLNLKPVEYFILWLN